MSSRSSKHKEKSSDSAHKEEIQSVNPRWLRPLIIAVAALYAVLHVYGAFEPGALNWGFHFFAFLLPATRVVLALAMLVVLIPSVQERLLGLTEKGVAGYASLTTLRKRIAIVAGLTVAVGIFWIGRETGYFLGDGLLALGNLSSIRRPENIPILLQNAPLSGIITWTFLKFLAAKEFANPETLSFQILSIGTGVICLILFALITRHMTTDRTERVLAFLFIVSTSTAQMFFGYVENYSPALLATVLFIYLTLEHLRGRVHVALPSLAFGLMFASHFGLFYMFPAVLFLYFIAARKRRWVSIGIAVVVMVVGT